MFSKSLQRMLFAVVLASLPTLAAAQHRLVTGAAKSAQGQSPTPMNVLRERAVTLNLPAAAKALSEAGPSLEIAFFDDAVFHVVLDRSEATQSGGRAYSGKVAVEPHSIVVIVDNGDAVSVQLSAPGRRFMIQGSAERGYVARQVADRDLPDHAPNYRPPMAFEVPAAVRGGERKVEATPPPQADDGSTIDVMVLYTAKAVLDNGGIGTMNANVDAQIALTNTIYANSNVVQRLRLVYKGQTSHVESDMDTDLDRIIGVGDGFLEEAPILRDLYQADLVSLWGDYSAGGFCGLGSLMANENASFAPRGYNVVASPDCTSAGSFTFAHELGHNMGLNHDNFMSPGTTQVTPEAGGGLTTITYAHGYIDLVNRFRTVMSYDNQCNGQVPSISCTRIPHFSNPAINYLNNPPYGSAVLATTGNAVTANERQALNDTRDTIANLRTALTTFTGPGVITFLPPAYSVAEGAGTVTLTVGRHVGSTGAVGVSYTTVAGTATAGADYTTKSGTLSWAAGDTADKTIVVAILQDTALEGNETFTVTLSAPTGGATISPAGTTATVRIIDDEPDTFPVGASLPAGYTTPNNPNANSPSSTWSVDTTQGRLSTASLQSAPMLGPDDPGVQPFTNFGNSDLEYTANFSAGTVSFYYKLSGYHQGFSGFEFQVDNVAVFSNNVGGEVDWTLVSQAITAGTHTLRWRFKNKLPFNCAGTSPAPPGGSNCADRAWIDTVTLPAQSGPPPNPPRLANISTRMQVLTGNNVMIAGFIIGGSTNKTVVIRARGPSLAPTGITNFLANPLLQLFSGQTQLASNDNFGSAPNLAALQASGFAPANALESAILTTLAPGAYTAIVTGAGGTTGVGLVEVFEVDAITTPLVNIATRGRVLTGNDVMIAGLIIQGSGPQQVVIRARGPSLAPTGISDFLANPNLQIFQGQTQIAVNDDWGSGADAAAIQAAGFAPADSRESAVMMTLQPGAYTAIVTGVGGTVGVGIVEVFTVP